MSMVNKIILRSKQENEPMDFERLKFLCYFVAGMVAEVLGVIVIIVIVLAMAGVL